MLITLVGGEHRVQALTIAGTASYTDAKAYRDREQGAVVALLEGNLGRRSRTRIEVEWWPGASRRSGEGVQRPRPQDMLHVHLRGFHL
jgi:hypothetical protein